MGTRSLLGLARDTRERATSVTRVKGMRRSRRIKARSEVMAIAICPSWVREQGELLYRRGCIASSVVSTVYEYRECIAEHVCRRHGLIILLWHGRYTINPQYTTL
jgi:hypothetical protein